MIKFIIGGIVLAGYFMFIPQIQKFVGKYLGIKPEYQPHCNIILTIGLIYYFTPFKHYTLGGICIAISLLIWVVLPKYLWLQKWFQNSLFNGHNILDKEAPYADVVNLFRLPLFGLGLFIINRYTTIGLDIAFFAAAFIKWVWTVKKAEIKPFLAKILPEDFIPTDKEKTDVATESTETATNL